MDHALLRDIGVLLLKRLPRRCQDMLCLLQGPCSFNVAFLIKTALLMPARFDYYLTVEVLVDMEVIKYRLDMGTLFLMN